MAGIEKICEYSGEHPGGLMYGYKHNHIQIMPKYRKLFRGAEHTLEIKKRGLYLDWKDMVQEYDSNEWTEYEPPFNSEAEFIEWKISKGERLVREYEYTLIVTDPKLQGNVEGRYLNYTFDLSSVKRRLKRMLRCRELNIIYL